MTYIPGTLIRPIDLVRTPHGRIRRQRGRIVGDPLQWHVIYTPEAARTVSSKPEEVA